MKILLPATIGSIMAFSLYFQSMLFTTPFGFAFTHTFRGRSHTEKLTHIMCVSFFIAIHAYIQVTPTHRHAK